MSEKEISIVVQDITLRGKLRVPTGAKNIVIFAHGSGSGWNSPRNVYVANFLGERGFATLLFDLLTEEEDETYQNRFNIPLLTRRLVDVTRWVMRQPDLQDMNIGYFGASTGAASALKATVQLGDVVHVIVSRGGRVDLAEEVLNKVEVATLLIIGGEDYFTLRGNQRAFDQLTCDKDLKVVKGATHLFEERGALEMVAKLAVEWFEMKFQYLHAPDQNQ